MSIKVTEFRHIPGVNDDEYIKLLEKHLERQTKLTQKAIAKLKSLSSAEPKTETVLCVLADRTCPFQGKEFAWCLTCPHISEEDRDLLKKAISEPKTGEWITDVYKLGKERHTCSECGEGSRYDSNYCPNCGSYNGGESR